MSMKTQRVAQVKCMDFCVEGESGGPLRERLEEGRRRDPNGGRIVELMVDGDINFQIQIYQSGNCVSR